METGDSPGRVQTPFPVLPLSPLPGTLRLGTLLSRPPRSSCVGSPVSPPQVPVLVTNSPLSSPAPGPLQDGDEGHIWTTDALPVPRGLGPRVRPHTSLSTSVVLPHLPFRSTQRHHIPRTKELLLRPDDTTHVKRDTGTSPHPTIHRSVGADTCGRGPTSYTRVPTPTVDSTILEPQKPVEVYHHRPGSGSTRASGTETGVGRRTFDFGQYDGDGGVVTVVRMFGQRTSRVLSDPKKVERHQVCPVPVGPVRDLSHPHPKTRGTKGGARGRVDTRPGPPGPNPLDLKLKAGPVGGEGSRRST